MPDDASAVRSVKSSAVSSSSATENACRPTRPRRWKTRVRTGPSPTPCAEAPEKWTRLKALLHEHRSNEYAYSRAVEFGETAKRQLRLFPPSQERDALTGLADYVLLRDR